MTEYRVIWQIDVDAHSPEEAALKALMIQRDRDSTAVVFEVQDQYMILKTVDLDDPIQIEKAKSQLYLVEDPFEEE